MAIFIQTKFDSLYVCASSSDVELRAIASIYLSWFKMKRKVSYANCIVCYQIKR